MYKTSKLTIFGGLILTMASLCSCQTEIKAPEPILPIPEQKQIDWQKMETYAFIHFGLNTFNDKEWGYGDSDPETFNPVKLDCEQWVKTLVAAGMKGVILTSKHHDGFCLWPTEQTEYSIRNSPYKKGQGDILRDLSDACKKYGIKLGLYLSPWDRNNGAYGTPEYVELYHKQLREIMTRYGDLFEIWFDGANGGDGYYGGAKEARKIDRTHYYNFPKIFEMIGELQPNAIIFTDGGPGARWVGNESGFAGATNWSFLRRGVVHPAYPKYRELQYGHADGNQWVAAECDVSIRPGWFYHSSQDNQVKTVDQLTDLYYRSVGHNATLLLNFPVDRDGLIHPIDSANAVNFHKNIQKQFANNLLKGMVAEVTDSRGGIYGSESMTDGDYDTYWATKDGIVSASATFRFKKETEVNRMLIQEYIPLGQRVKSFVVEYNDGTQWLPVQMNEETTTVGYKRLLRFKTVKTDAVRIRFIDSRACLTINNVEAYYVGESGDFSLTDKVESIQGLPLTIMNLPKEEAEKAFDKKNETTCFVEGNELLLDLGKEYTISSFYYLPDQSEYNKGLIHKYQLFVGTNPDGIDMKVKEGEFSNIQNNPILQSVYFTPVKARYVRLKATQMVSLEEKNMGLGEIAVR